MHFSIITLFEEMFPGSLGFSLARKAYERGIWSYQTYGLRHFSENKHGTVDDKPFGGGNGLVLCPDIAARAIDAAGAKRPHGKVIYFTPRGSLLTQPMIRDLVACEHVIILCGRFEGVDQRVLDHYNALELSIGDYILSGGELAALVFMDSCIRLLPGVLKNQDTLQEETFGRAHDYAGLLEYPLYTRPSIWRGIPVPDVLLSGHHAAVEGWRLQQAQHITKVRRPDLWQTYLAANSLHHFEL